MNLQWLLFFSLSFSFSLGATQTGISVDSVLVDKSSRKMYLLQNHRIIKSYRISLGENPKGHKRQQGDKRTPEGEYTLDFINEQSNYYRSVHINYPNKKDIARAKRRGVNPGGQIMIHGQKNGVSPYRYERKDWTNGCIAMTNAEIDEFITFVKMGTPIDIRW